MSEIILTDYQHIHKPVNFILLSKSRGYIMRAAGSLSLEFSMRRSSEQKCNLLQECLKSCTSQPAAELLLDFCGCLNLTDVPEEAPGNNKNTVNSQGFCVRFLGNN